MPVPNHTYKYSQTVSYNDGWFEGPADGTSENRANLLAGSTTGKPVI